MFRHRQCNSAYMCICRTPPCYYMLHSNDKAGHRIHSDLKEMHYIYFQLGIFAGLFSSARELKANVEKFQDDLDIKVHDALIVTTKA